MLLSRALLASRLPPSYSFINSYSSTTDQTVYTFSSCDIGTAQSTRNVVITITARSSSVRSISSVTIGGVTATQAAYISANSNATIAAIYVASIPTGTTADVVVTFSGGMVRCLIGVYALYNLNSSSTVNYGTSSDRGVTWYLTDVKPKDIIISTSLYQSNSYTCTWTGVNKDFETSLESSDMSSASIQSSTTSNNYEVAASWSLNLNDAAHCFAQWR